MIYKFKSKAAGDVIMLGPTGERVLGLIGKDATPQGIIEPAQMPAASKAPIMPNTKSSGVDSNRPPLRMPLEIVSATSPPAR